MTNLSTYQRLEDIDSRIDHSAINIFVTIVSLVVYFAMLLRCAYFKVLATKRGSSTHGATNSSIISNIPKVFFKDILRKEVEVEIGGRKFLVLQTRTLPLYTESVLVTLTIWIILLCCTTCISMFEFHVSYDCNPSLDCFPFGHENKPLLELPLPIDDCLFFMSNGNGTIKCYHFVFRYAEGIGLIGGVIVLAKLTITAFSSLTFWFCDLSSMPKAITRRRICI